MNLKEIIARHLLDVHNGDNWTEVNLADTLKGISFRAANEQTGASKNSIAMLVHHISFWNRAIALRAKGIKPVIDEHNGFEVGLLKSEDEWRALQEDNVTSANELAEAISAFDESKLWLPILPDHSTAYKNFQGQVEHVHYHTGQIMCIKKLLRL